MFRSHLRYLVTIVWIVYQQQSITPLVLKQAGVTSRCSVKGNGNLIATFLLQLMVEQQFAIKQPSSYLIKSYSGKVKKTEADVTTAYLKLFTFVKHGKPSYLTKKESTIWHLLKTVHRFRGMTPKKLTPSIRKYHYSPVTIGGQRYQKKGTIGERKVWTALAMIDQPIINIVFQSYVHDLDPTSDHPNRSYDFLIILKDGKRLLIEYDGQFHYHPISFVGGQTALLERQQVDQWKDDFAKKMEIPLLRIKYGTTLPMMISYISFFIQSFS